MSNTKCQMKMEPVLNELIQKSLTQDLTLIRAQFWDIGPIKIV